MGPQPLPRNSTSGPFVASFLGSQDRVRRERAFGGAFFAGGGRDRFVASLKPGGKVAVRSRAAFSPSACWPGFGPRDARRCGGLRSVRPFDWEGLFSVPSDRGWTRVGDNPRRFQGLRLFGRLPIRPVLKHGPRSLTCARVIGLDEI